MKQLLHILFLFAWVLIGSSNQVYGQQLTAVYPKADQVVNSLPLTLLWNKATDAITYDVQYADNANFTGATTITGLAANSYSISTLVGGKYYYFRARAVTSSGTSAWAATQRFLYLTPDHVPGLIFWIKADGNLTTDPFGVVSQWNDEAGTNHLTQTDPSKRPSKVANGLLGKPVVKFDGTNDVLLGGDVLDFNNNSRTSFVLGQNNASAGTYYAKSVLSTGLGRYGLLYNSNVLRVVLSDTINNAPTYVFSSYTYGKIDLLTVTFDRTLKTGNLRINSQPQASPLFNPASTAASVNSSYRFLVGAYNDATDVGETLWLKGYIAEMFFYSAALSDSTSLLLEKYLKDKFSPPVNLGADTTVGYGFCPIVLDAGPRYKNYNWVNGPSTRTYSVSAPGDYIVAVTDSFDRVTRDTIRVQFPNANYTGVNAICFGDSVQWDTKLSPANYSFNWSNGKTTSSIYISSPGTYGVTITDINSCSSYTTPVTFTIDSFTLKTTLTANNDTSLCSGNLLGFSRGANLITSYVWSTGETTPRIAIDTTGTYSVTITNSIGCVKQDYTDVTITGQGPTVSFTADTVCRGSATTFTNLSSIDPPFTIQQYIWVVNGTDTFTTPNLSYTFANSGVFNVSLTAVSNFGCASTPITKQVMVRPTANAFFVDSVGCVGSPLYFFDGSTAPSGDSIISYFWDFGNNTSTAKNPNNTFNAIGIYPVSLTITSRFGCTATFSRNVDVSTNQPTPEPFSLISPINDMNESAANIAFQWQNSPNASRYEIQVSTTASFSTLVANQSTYINSISLSLPYRVQPYYWRVVALNVCGDTYTSSVNTIYHFKPDIISDMTFWVMADGNVVKNGSNQVSQWLNQTGGSNNVVQPVTALQPTWIPSVVQLDNKPVIRFAGSSFLSGGDILDLGTKSRYCFIVGKANNVPSTYVAKSLLAAYQGRYAINYRSSAELQVLLEDIVTQQVLSTPGIGGKYELINGSINRLTSLISLIRNSSVLQQRSGAIGSSLDLNTPYRFLVGAYNSADDLSQVNPLDGDIAEIIFYDKELTQDETKAVEKYIYTKYSRPVWLGPDVTIKYGFCDSVILNASDRYVSYLWNTGATTQTIKATVSGTYWVEVVDVFDQIYRDSVVVTLPSVALPTVNSICLGDSILWNADLGPAYSYAWNTGETTPNLSITAPGSYFITIADTNSPQCTYVSKTLNVQLDSFAITTTLGPDTTICGGATIGLKSSTQGIIAYNWSTNASSPTIPVNNAGTYWVNVLNVTGCQASDTINVDIAGQLADVNFTAPNAFCIGDTSYFTNTSTIQAPYNITGYKWTFAQNGDSSLLPNPSYYYNATGTYTVNLQVTADSGCVSNLSKTIQVFNKPTAKFGYQIGCAGAPIPFSDQSVGVANDALAQWLWSFGDDSISTARNPSHTYAQSGIYAVSLTVTSTTGCASVFYDTLEVFPQLVVDIAVDNLCFGETTQFTDASPGFSNITWLWEFGANNDVSSLKNPTYNYTQTGNYLVKLTVKNSLGCVATTDGTISIVQPPTANFTYNVACEDFNFRLNDASTVAGNDPIAKWLWEFNDGGLPSHAPNPVRTYDTVGIFNVTLSVESANGCPASITKPITIAPAPTASFTFTPDYGAAPLPVTYTNTSVGATSYQWYFGDGATSNDVDPVHTFGYNSDFTTTLIATGPGGCRDTFSNNLTVNISTLDIAVVEIDAENINGRVRPYATIINQGTRNVDHYYLTSSLGDGSRITERIDTFLKSGTGMIYYFVAGYEATEYQASSFLCIQASQPNDEVDDNAFNDRLCKPLENDIRIVPPYPNPAQDAVTFEILMPREAQLEIHMYDVLGHKLMTVYDALAPKGTQTFKLDLNGYPRGVYILKVRFNDADDYILRFVAE